MYLIKDELDGVSIIAPNGEEVCFFLSGQEGEVNKIVAELNKLHIANTKPPVISLRGVDEYGPMLDWYRPWTDFPVGTKFHPVTHV